MPVSCGTGVGLVFRTTSFPCPDWSATVYTLRVMAARTHRSPTGGLAAAAPLLSATQSGSPGQRGVEAGNGTLYKSDSSVGGIGHVSMSSAQPAATSNHRRQTTSAGHWLASMPLGGRQDVPGMVDPISTRPRQGQPSRLQPRTGSRCGPVRQPRA
ncbi:unnamed protein product [Arctogadus glacialis]